MSPPETGPGTSYSGMSCNVDDPEEPSLQDGQEVKQQYQGTITRKLANIHLAALVIMISLMRLNLTGIAGYEG